jgi:ATP-dependent DNA helicase RecQ
MTWRAILEKNAEEAKADPAFLAHVFKHLDDIDRFCRGVVCRHRSLVEYFGQTYEPENCSACDLCLGDTQELADALVVAQKILSCVARVRERFGIGHVINVLRGREEERVRKFGHDRLSTFGLLREHREVDIRDWIYQLLSQKVLRQNDVRLSSGDTVQVLGLNAASWEVMKGQREVRLLQLVRRKKGERAARSKAEETSWEEVDRGLFEELRTLRRNLAQERGVQPYMVFSDNTLRELARVRPSTLERMHYVYGVGEAKLRDFGQAFLDRIADHCGKHALTRDNSPAPPAKAEEARKPLSARPNPQRTLAFEQFREGATVEDVMHQTGRARATVMDYLCEFIREERPKTIRTWVPDEVYDRVAMAARQVGTDRLKPIFLQLGEQVPYDEIRLVLAHLTAG